MEHDEFDFSSFLLALSSATLTYLGFNEDGVSQPASKNLAVARHNIEIICMLKSKTAGNLTSEEKVLLDDILRDLRFKYVEVSKN